MPFRQRKQTVVMLRFLDKWWKELEGVVYGYST